ncbi:PHD finger protein 21B isoform X2 [Corythoichthys intestinalis]|uniref:PHD finger protein 21B isoform X2 n=1 Tax=Corythoichthys intestinalis TaxID=161448 RepID=UPI0025A51196|nr:PHD finger protein 21B isoform X2 [Corythoichthys intestinalis]
MPEDVKEVKGNGRPLTLAARRRGLSAADEQQGARLMRRCAGWRAGRELNIYEGQETSMAALFLSLAHDNLRDFFFFSSFPPRRLANSLCEYVQKRCPELAARSCPAGAGKPLSLIKTPGQGISISVVPAKVVNGAAPPQTSPVNLQTGGRAALGPGARPPQLLKSQILSPLGSIPAKVPQVSPLYRLAGQAAGALPQVSPKTLIPDSLPRGPCRDTPRPRGPECPAVHRLGPKCAPSPRRRPYDGAAPFPAGDAGGPASGGAGVAYAIIAASPADANGVAAVSEAVKVGGEPPTDGPTPQPDRSGYQVIIIQPQAPGGGEGGSLPPPSLASAEKTDEDPEKISFMVALGLVTNEHSEELQLKRQERKRRSTANPAYSGLFEPERKRLASHYLNGSLFLSARDSEDFCWKDEAERDEQCAVCRRDGELRPCHNCPRAFHPDCLRSPLETPPEGPWYCPKCHKKVLNKENMSWPHNFARSYVTHKTVRQEEKRRLLRRNVELKKECAHLEEEDEQLDKTLKRCLARRERLSAQQRDTLASLERLKALVKLIQVSVTAGPASSPSPRTKSPTSTTGSPLRPSRDNVAD